MKRSVTLIACILMLAMSISACGAETAEGAKSAAPEAAESQSSEASAIGPEENESGTVQEISSEAIDKAKETSETDETNTESNVITGGSTLEDAEMLQPNVRYTGSFSGDDLWISFTTSDQESTEYTITLENLTVGSESLDGYLVDEYGNGLKATELHNGDNDRLRTVRANQDGTADSAMFDHLEPNTTYYLRLQGNSKVDYSLRITNSNEEPFDPTLGRKTPSDNDALITSTNQDDAPLLVLNTRYRGKYENGYQWIVFKTSEKEGVPYTVTLENLTVGSESLDGYLVDEYGNGLKATELHNGDNDRLRTVRANQDGTADSAMFDYLEPNTTYYLRLQGNSKVDYILTINGPEAPQFLETTADNVEGFVSLNSTDIPGTSLSFALNIPLGTKVSAKYTDGYSWLAFTTSEIEGAEYYVSLINCTVGSESLDGYLVDEYGNGLKATTFRNGDNDRLRTVRAEQDGRADTAMFDNLKPNTTYYLRLQCESKAEYTIRVSSPSSSNDNTNVTSSNLSEVVGELDENVEFYTGTNQNIATLLKTNTRYRGNYANGYSWVSFTTGEDDNAQYSVTLENLTVGSAPLDGYLVDEYGNGLKATEFHNGDNDRHRTVRAKDDGTPDTAMFDYLEPNTTYYLWIHGDSKADYILIIGAPKEEENNNTIVEEPVEEVVFEVPFELNETQIRFVANEAIFIDEEAAKAALAPVAEIILAHPDHPILLAGTTAHWGSQDSCVNLSNRRAGAVKDLLVNYFGVPESQLVTAGLGYADDPFVRGQDVDSNGNFVETEGAKNRRVVVLDAESDIARQILGN